MKTILITGTSSGIGKATAIYFAEQGRNVAATMRNPQKETELIKYPNIKLFRIDVTDENTISQAMIDINNSFGKIDVLCNNAGYGLVGSFEAMSLEQIKKQFDTNVFGVMNMIRAILPNFREKKAGTIITVTSMGGLFTIPTYSIYHSTKRSLEGFLESLQFELKQFGIKIKIIEPGVIRTDFYNRSMEISQKQGLNDYDDYVKVVNKNMSISARHASGPEIVAKKIYLAATDTSNRLRYTAGGNSSLLIFLRNILPTNLFNKIISKIIER